MMQKGQTLIYLLIGLLILAIVAGGAYYLGRQRSQTLEAKLPEQNPAILLSPGDKPNLDDETANWKTYVNNALKYQISYPENSQYQKNYPGRSQLTEYDSDSTRPSYLGSTNINLVLENNDEMPSISYVGVIVWKNLGIKVVDIASRDEWCKKLQPELQGQQSCHYKSERQIEKAELNNFQAFKADGGRDNSLESVYYVPYRDYIYQIVIARPLQDLDNPLPGKVLSTFKFTQ